MPVSVFRLPVPFSQNECVHRRAFAAYCRGTRRSAIAISSSESLQYVPRRRATNKQPLIMRKRYVYAKSGDRHSIPHRKYIKNYIFSTQLFSGCCVVLSVVFIGVLGHTDFLLKSMHKSSKSFGNLFTYPCPHHSEILEEYSHFLFAMKVQSLLPFNITVNSSLICIGSLHRTYSLYQLRCSGILKLPFSENLFQTLVQVIRNFLWAIYLPLSSLLIVLRE